MLSYQLSDTHVCSHDLDLSHINDHSLNLFSDQSINSETQISFSLFMGLICSRRSRSTPAAPPIAAPLLPASDPVFQPAP